jgi:nucleoside-triphosphatase THEP1
LVEDEGTLPVVAVAVVVEAEDLEPGLTAAGLVVGLKMVAVEDQPFGGEADGGVGIAGVAGVISRSLLNADGLRTGLEAWMLPAGDTLELAVVGGALSEAAPNAMASGGDLFLGPWHFSRKTLDAVNAHLASVVQSRRGGGDAVVVVDEIGPLEMRRRDGFWPGFAAVADSDVSAIIVVRPSLVDELVEVVSARVPRRAAVGIHVVRHKNPEEISATIRQILGML